MTNNTFKIYIITSIASILKGIKYIKISYLTRTRRGNQHAEVLFTISIQYSAKCKFY
jgi:hypothetical protein